MTQGKPNYPHIKFGVTKESIHKTAIRGRKFMNFLAEKYPELLTAKNPALRNQAWKEWFSMSLSERDEYGIIRKDGTVRLDYIQKEVRINGERKELAY